MQHDKVTIQEADSNTVRRKLRCITLTDDNEHFLSHV